MTDLWRSRRFWTMVVGGGTTLIVYFVGKYFAQGLEDVQVVLDVGLPLVGLLIIMYTVDDVAQTWTRANIEMEQLRTASMTAIAQAQMQTAVAASNAAVASAAANKETY